MLNVVCNRFRKQLQTAFAQFYQTQLYLAVGQLFDIILEQQVGGNKLGLKVTYNPDIGQCVIKRMPGNYLGFILPTQSAANASAPS